MVWLVRARLRAVQGVKGGVVLLEHLVLQSLHGIVRVYRGGRMLMQVQA